MTTALLAAVLALVPVQPQQLPLPTDPLQRCAYRVVRGDYPGAPAWKVALYRDVLLRGTTVDGLARRTNYCPSCSGRTCADGSRVRRGVCAAPRSVPMHSIVWLASDGLLKVTDRGGAVRVGGGYTTNGENMRLDVWQPRCGRTCQDGTRRRVPWAVVRTPRKH